jgi:methylenetetrahydrofolate reductase (NADPH)
VGNGPTYGLVRFQPVVRREAVVARENSLRNSRAVAALGRGRIRVSFEFFPPKTEEMERALWEAIQRLAPLAPSFVSVTYGAAGSTRERTHGTVKRMLAETALVPAAHLTCVGAARADIDAVARSYWDAGVRHVVALRGDPPDGVGGNYQPFPGGYDYADALVAGLKRIGDFEISVAAFPEKHPESRSIDDDLDVLARKLDAGASRAITQFFFDNDAYYRFLERARRRGISAPVVPGILPVQNFQQTRRFAEKACASVPRWLAERFAGLDDDVATRKLVAATVAAEQVLDLVDHGVSDFHFYTMNRADLVFAICHLLGLRPVPRRDFPTEEAGDVRRAANH